MNPFRVLSEIQTCCSVSRCARGKPVLWYSYTDPSQFAFNARFSLSSLRVLVSVVRVRGVVLEGGGSRYIPLSVEVFAVPLSNVSSGMYWCHEITRQYIRSVLPLCFGQMTESGRCCGNACLRSILGMVILTSTTPSASQLAFIDIACAPCSSTLTFVPGSSSSSSCTESAGSSLSTQSQSRCIGESHVGRDDGR